MPITSKSEKETCPVCEGLGYLYRDVEPGHPDFGNPIICRCKEGELARKRLEDLRQASNLGLLSRLTFKTFKPEGYGLPPRQKQNLRRAYELAREYAEQPQGWLILTGGYGCGKTHLAAAIANYCVEQGRPTLFVVVPDLLDHLRAAFRPDSPVTYDQRFEMVRTAPLLILDDLGAQSTTPWAQEKLYQILNYRYNAQLPTVITTNHRLEEIDPRFLSRMTDPDLCQIYIIEAPDFRGSVGNPYDALNRLSLHSDMTFESFDPQRTELPAKEQRNLRQAYEIAKEYAKNPEGWLVFMGRDACGKTHLAAAIANYRQGLGYPARLVVVPDLLDHLRATFAPHSTVSYDKEFEKVRTAPFLVLDDLGTESATPWAREKLYQIFNFRYQAKLPTVITMQQTLEEIDPRLGSRMQDHSLCTIYPIAAPPYRGAVVRKRQKRARKR